ncbi:hypothetical protein B0T10DRAFT_556126 [Thelonectria olida]|uniref:PinX1-related protein 1 n=1 Tax=Thelonectria olida TaxID=1576542 RepID=A0A9P9AVF7_9HYPO|nr:hypothetical protein B0T10DRAFT_556126 [Thelonectria olida]
MGILHEGHSKRKINKDPNNTKWTRDTNTFGQKILRAQGWQPGQYLGAQDAPHSELHTSANASYIRVVLKDDMKGLGFNKAKEDEVTGLGVFQDLLSRLNGKSEAAVEEDRQARLAIKCHQYVEQKYGPMRFVRGGLLVGDELKEVPEDDESRSEAEAKSEDNDVEMEVDSAQKESKKDKKSKKRKASDADEDTSDRENESKSKKRRKEERKLKAAEDSTDDTKAKKKEKKLKKDKSRSKKAAESSEDETIAEKEKSKKRKSKSKDKSQSPEESEDDQVKESKKSKKEKKEKKDKKDKKKRRKEEAETSDSATLVSTPAESTAGTGTSTPTLVGTGTSTPRGSRNFVRSRFIAQKRQAVLDTKALAQIFMVKA